MKRFIELLACVCLLMLLISAPSCAFLNEACQNYDANCHDNLWLLYMPRTPAISNIKDNGVLQSGFIVGTAPTDTVKITIDGGTTQYVSVIAGRWKYSLPTGASAWREGSTHEVIVEPPFGNFDVTVRVRKGANRDVNGDGYPDVVTSSYNYSGGGGTGRLYIFHSSGATGVSTAGAGAANTIITGGAPLDNFGYSVALGDVNGDGYADVISGAPLYSTATGRVYVFHSSGTNGVTITGVGSASSTITGETVNDNFGSSVASGDVNGDGYADVIAGARTYPNTGNTGRVYIFHSSGTGGVSITLAASASRIISGEAGSAQCGSSLATGDVNGDGYADVIAGAPAYSGAQGRAYIFHSAGSSGISIILAASASRIITGEAGGGGDYFGVAVTAGDINGDGYSDVVAGANGYSAGVYNGRVYVFHSTGTGGVSITAAGSASSILTGVSNNDHLGFSVATGDINGDGYYDVVTGAYRWNSNGNTGRVYIFHSTGSSGVQTAGAASASSMITGTAGGDYFGAALSVVDINCDGYADVLAGAYGVSASKGATYLFQSSGANGVTITAAASATAVITGEVGLDSMGFRGLAWNQVLREFFDWSKI